MKYGILRRLKSGIRLYINPTHKCDLGCKHCNWKLFNGNMPGTVGEKCIADWVRFLNGFPVKISEVFILGGEPTQYKHLNIIIALLLKKKICVTVYTNLMSDTLKTMYPNSRLRIVGTYHGYHFGKFLHNLSELKFHKVIVKELGVRKIFTKNKHVLIDKHELKDIDRVWNGLAVGPDFKIFTTYRSYLNEYKEVTK